MSLDFLGSQFPFELKGSVREGRSRRTFTDVQSARWSWPAAGGRCSQSTCCVDLKHRLKRKRWPTIWQEVTSHFWECRFIFRKCPHAHIIQAGCWWCLEFMFCASSNKRLWFTRAMCRTIHNTNTIQRLNQVRLSEGFYYSYKQQIWLVQTCCVASI